jgi:hypothetical protein
MQTTICPLCQVRWGVEPNGTGASTVRWATCANCEEALPQDVHGGDEDTEVDDGPADQPR